VVVIVWYGSWIYNYLDNQCLSPLKLRVRTSRWFSPGTPVSSTNKTDGHDITEILLKVASNTINQKTKRSLIVSNDDVRHIVKI
jgi:hypothetical protein